MTLDEISTTMTAEEDDFFSGQEDRRYSRGEGRGGNDREENGRRGHGEDRRHGRGESRGGDDREENGRRGHGEDRRHGRGEGRCGQDREGDRRHHGHRDGCPHDHDKDSCHQDECRAFDPEEEDLICLMRHCGRAMFRGKKDRHSQDRILFILSDRGEMTQRELQEFLHVQPGSMSEILTKLESVGFLVRVRDEEDRRRVILRITPDGRERARELKAIGESETFAALSIEEQAVLKEMLIRLIRSWEQPRGEEPES